MKLSPASRVHAPIESATLETLSGAGLTGAAKALGWVMVLICHEENYWTIIVGQTPALPRFGGIQKCVLARPMLTGWQMA